MQIWAENFEEVFKEENTPESEVNESPIKEDIKKTIKAFKNNAKME